MERASTQARLAGEGERNVSLILAEVRTDIMSAVRKYCVAVRALEAMTEGVAVKREAAEKRDRLRKMVRTRMPMLLMKSKMVGELEGIVHRAQAAEDMWQHLAEDIHLGAASISMSVGLANYRGSGAEQKGGWTSRPLSGLRLPRPPSGLRTGKL